MNSQPLFLIVQKWDFSMLGNVGCFHTSLDCLCFSVLFSKIPHTLRAVLELTVRMSSSAHCFPRRPQPFFHTQPYLRANIPPHSRKLSYINFQALSTKPTYEIKDPASTKKTYTWDFARFWFLKFNIYVPKILFVIPNPDTNARR